MTQALRLCLSLLVSGFFLWLAFRHIDVAAVTQTLRQLRPWPIVLYVLSLVATQIFRALRWHVLVRPFAPVSRWTSWRISNVGNMLILLLPLRLGEFARPYMLRRETGARLTSGIGAAVVERAIDGVLVTLLFFLTTSLLPSQYAVAPALHWGAILALAVFLGASAVLALGLWRRVWIDSWRSHASSPAVGRSIWERRTPPSRAVRLAAARSVSGRSRMRLRPSPESLPSSRPPTIFRSMAWSWRAT